MTNEPISRNKPLHITLGALISLIMFIAAIFAYTSTIEKQLASLQAFADEGSRYTKEDAEADRSSRDKKLDQIILLLQSK